jgi:hypothetical protein
MNTPAFSKKEMVARVAIDVRLYFDVSTSSEKSEDIQRAAREELERAADEELVRIKKLRFPNIYPIDRWHTVQPENFQVCQISEAHEANRETRFAL